MLKIYISIYAFVCAFVTRHQLNKLPRKLNCSLCGMYVNICCEQGAKVCCEQSANVFIELGAKCTPENANTRLKSG